LEIPKTPYSPGLQWFLAFTETTVCSAISKKHAVTSFSQFIMLMPKTVHQQYRDGLTYVDTMCLYCLPRGYCTF